MCAGKAYVPKEERKLPQMTEGVKKYLAQLIAKYAALNDSYGALGECVEEYHPETKGNFD